MKKQNILIIHELYEENATTISEHYKSFEVFGNNNYIRIAPDVIERGLVPRIFLECFDVVILHYSLYYPKLLNTHPRMCGLIKKLDCIKSAFIQDEYRFINNSCEAMKFLEVSDIFSVCLPEARDKIYGQMIKCGVRLHTTLTGFARLPDIDFIPFKDRVWDISYRGRPADISTALGSKSREKSEISDGVQLKLNSLLKLNLSTYEQDRIYGEAWINLLKNSKATLITISGSSICDFDGSISDTIQNIEKLPKIEREKFEDKLKEMDGDINATAISPRIFEAALSRCVMLGFIDHYNNILVPNEDYVVIDRDFGNLHKIIDLINDEKELTRISDNAYKKLILSGKYSWSEFVLDFEKTINFIKSTQERNTDKQNCICGSTTLNLAFKCIKYYCNLLKILHYLNLKIQPLFHKIIRILFWIARKSFTYLRRLIFIK